ncbi:hypothetical protein BKK40_08065 [Bacillus cereus]|nr:hypothetical protein BKK40_08065 [Bacillus cereus]
MRVMEFEKGYQILSESGYETTVEFTKVFFGIKQIWFRDLNGFLTWNTSDRLKLLSKGKAPEVKVYKETEVIQRMLDGHIVKLKSEDNTAGLLRKYENGLILVRSMKPFDKWEECQRPLAFYLNNEFVDYEEPLDYEPE